jgi:hypothetical protein
MRTQILLVGCALAAASWSSRAEETPARSSVQIRYERMEWREFDREGNQLLKESGPRVGLLWEHETRDATWPDGLFRALAYLGDVDYDGQTQLGQPIESTTEYHGAQAEAAMLFPVAINPSSALIPFAGAGGHTWLRRLDNTGGFAETGYDEWWVDLYVQAGLGWRGLLNRGEAFARLGIRYPLFTRVEYDLTLPDGTDNASVEPGANINLFAECGYRAGGYTLSIYAEDTTYERSDEEIYGPVSIYQPESEQQTIGIQFGVVF